MYVCYVVCTLAPREKESDHSPFHLNRRKHDEDDEESQMCLKNNPSKAYYRNKTFRKLNMCLEHSSDG